MKLSRLQGDVIWKKTPKLLSQRSARPKKRPITSLPMELAMHNYTLQCFGKVAALTNDKGLHLGAFPLSTGYYVGLLAVPNCLKSLKLEGMAIGLKWTDDGLFMALSRGDFWCNLIAKGSAALPDGLTMVMNWDGSACTETGYIDPPKPSEGAELLKLVPAKLRKGAKYHDDGKYVHSGGLTITKKQDHASVDYWGGVEPLKGLITPPDKSCTTVRIEFDGHNYAYEFDHAKLIEKLSKKATFGPYQSGIAAYLDGVSYFFRSMGTSNFTYITLSLNTTMEQVA